MAKTASVPCAALSLQKAWLTASGLLSTTVVLDAAGDNSRMLLRLRQRMSRIRVFDPACGSGNFLVIAYKQMRSIEAKINLRRSEAMRPTDIPTNNFRGIEIRDFAAEVARLALVIAEYQCDVAHRGPLAAKAEFLPLNEMNWITCGNALRLDWLQVCPPDGTGVKLHSDDLFQTPLDQTAIDFENDGGETFICGNPPYMGSTWQDNEQKLDMRNVLHGRCRNVGNLDYVAGWFVKAADYGAVTCSTAAFVTTNSICQGQAVPDLWPVIYEVGADILFAHTSFKWANLASHNAGVTVAIVGVGPTSKMPRKLYIPDGEVDLLVREGASITPYLTFGAKIVVEKHPSSLSKLAEMEKGSQPTDGGHLLLNLKDAREGVERYGVEQELIRPILGSEEFIKGVERRCLWIEPERYAKARKNAWLEARFSSVARMRLESPKLTTQRLAGEPYRFGKIRSRGGTPVTIIPSVSSERREWFPAGHLRAGCVVSNLALAIYDSPLWNLALITSKVHLVWIGTVCGKLKTDFRYSNLLGWNTFPVPQLTERNKSDLTRCAEDILLAREAHFPATIADLYDPETMPENLRAAHEANDEVLERIYIGRRFRNDTERLEKLFEMYTKMTGMPAAIARPAAKRARRATA